MQPFTALYRHKIIKQMLTALNKIALILYKMKNIFNSLLIALVLLSFFTNCGKNETEDIIIPYGFEYFPTDSSTYIIYQVDSVLYSSFATEGKDSVSWEVKEVWDTQFEDLQGKPARTLLRYQRPTGSTTNWANIIPTVWYAVQDSNRAERMEGEERWVKLVFPIRENATWNGSAYINTTDPTLAAYQNWLFTYLNINTPQTINGQNFAETITIERTNNDENLVEKKLYKEVYAKGIGSVYKEEWVLNLGGNDITNPQPWPQRAERGYTTTSKILSYCLQDCD